MDTIYEITYAVENGRIKNTQELICSALIQGHEPGTILENGLVAAMNDISRKYSNDEVFISDILVASKAVKKGLDLLYPLLSVPIKAHYGTFIIGTIEGDRHDFGKNLVALMMETAGFHVIDLGVNVPTSRFIEAINANPDCRIVGISLSLTTSMSVLRETIREIRQIDFRQQPRLMVGGSSLYPFLAESVGADAYTTDAASAVCKAIELLGDA